LAIVFSRVSVGSAAETLAQQVLALLAAFAAGALGTTKELGEL
jgi:hypothetical protein